MAASGQLVRIRKGDYLLMIGSSVFNPFLYFLCENYGLKYSSSTIASIIIATIPVFTPLVAFITYRERLTVVNFLGIFISFGGVIIMLIRPDLSLAIDSRGILFLAGAVISAMIYSVFLKKLTVRYSPLTIVSYQNLIGIVLFLPVFIFFDNNRLFSVSLNAEIVSAFLFLAILASSLSFVYFTKTIQLFGMSKANIFSNLIPVFTAIFSYLILSEIITFQKIAGMVIVIGGIFLSERSRRKSLRT
jgi:drug/metabolite transporter (DMT)-like permease